MNVDFCLKLLLQLLLKEIEVLWLWERLDITLASVENKCKRERDMHECKHDAKGCEKRYNVECNPCAVALMIRVTTV